MTVDQHVFLIGRPPVGEFLAYVRMLAVDAGSHDEGELVAEWRAANDHVRQLEWSEPGIADNPPLLPLPSELEPLVRRMAEQPYFRRAFQYVPFELAMVELDRLVVFQKHINLAQVHELRQTLPPEPSPEEVFHLCFPMDREPPVVQITQNAHNSFTFVSKSKDFRYVEPVVLRPDQVDGYRSMGPVMALLGIVVGYGANFLNAWHIENRIVLSNGSHRAFALREHGITHVPCLVQKVTRREELELVGTDVVSAHPDRYLTNPRPPMLKDYFDPKLRKILNVARKHRLVTLSFGVDTTEIPAQ